MPGILPGFCYTINISEKTIFKKIIDKEVPAYILYEDGLCLVFLDVFPSSPGHTLIIPKQETFWVWDAPEYAHIMKLAREVALAQKEVFGIDMIFMSVRGDEVPHAHVHVRPNLPKDGTEKNFEDIQIKMSEAIKKRIN